MTINLIATCQKCGTRLGAGVGGILHVDISEVNRVEAAHREYERTHPRSRPIDALALMSLPDDARWRIECGNCTPADEGYAIEIERCMTWPDLVEWTAHLSEKTWLRYTNWFNFIRSVALGEPGAGLAQPTE